MTKKKLLAFQLKLEGKTYYEISQATSWSEYTLRHYFSSKGKWNSAFQEWSKKEVDGVQDLLHTIFIANAREAALTILRLMKSEQSGVAMRAAQDILDRAGFAKSSKSFEDPSDTSVDVAEKITKWFESRGG